MSIRDNSTKLEDIKGYVERLPSRSVFISSTSVTPSKEEKTYTPPEGVDGYRQFTVFPIPNEYIIPTGSTTINTNGTHPVSEFASVIVNVSGSDFTTEEKTVNPTESVQEVTPTSANALSKVTVNAIANNYVGSAITKNPTPTVSGATVTIPSGYYSSQTTKSVASGTEGTPSASKGSVTNHSISITPTVTNTAGYITGGTKTGNAVTVSASELVSGSETKIANGSYDVTNLQTLVVNVPQLDTSDANATSSDIVSGKSAYVNGSKVNGQLVIQKYYTGSSTPSSSLGNNGDLYLMV